MSTQDMYEYLYTDAQDNKTQSEYTNPKDVKFSKNLYNVINSTNRNLRRQSLSKILNGGRKLQLEALACAAYSPQSFIGLIYPQDEIKAKNIRLSPEVSADLKEYLGAIEYAVDTRLGAQGWRDLAVIAEDAGSRKFFLNKIQASGDVEQMYGVVRDLFGDYEETRERLVSEFGENSNQVKEHESTLAPYISNIKSMGFDVLRSKKADKIKLWTLFAPSSDTKALQKYLVKLGFEVPLPPVYFSETVTKAHEVLEKGTARENLEFVLTHNIPIDCISPHINKIINTGDVRDLKMLMMIALNSGSDTMLSRMMYRLGTWTYDDPENIERFTYGIKGINRISLVSAQQSVKNLYPEIQRAFEKIAKPKDFLELLAQVEGRARDGYLNKILESDDSDVIYRAMRTYRQNDGRFYKRIAEVGDARTVWKTAMHSDSLQVTELMRESIIRNGDPAYNMLYACIYGGTCNQLRLHQANVLKVPDFDREADPVEARKKQLQFAEINYMCAKLIRYFDSHIDISGHEEIVRKFGDDNLRYIYAKNIGGDVNRMMRDEEHELDVWADPALVFVYGATVEGADKKWCKERLEQAEQCPEVLLHNLARKKRKPLYMYYNLTNNLLRSVTWKDQFLSAESGEERAERGRVLKEKRLRILQQVLDKPMSQVLDDLIQGKEAPEGYVADVVFLSSIANSHLEGLKGLTEVRAHIEDTDVAEEEITYWDEADTCTDDCAIQ